MTVFNSPRRPGIARPGTLLRATLVAALAVVCAGPPSAAADSEPLERFESWQTHMGAKFTIVIYAPDQSAADRGFQQAFERIRQLDAILSDYKPDSELSRLSDSSPTTSPIRLGDDLFRVLDRSQEMSSLSGGAFDVTVGPLTKLWRRARRQRELPPDDLLRKARDAVGFQHLELDRQARTAQLLRPGMRLDLGGIAKGFAADEALAVLRKLDLPRAMVNAGGGLAIGAPPPGEKGWKLGIAPLIPDASPQQFLLLADCGVATSGDSQQHVEINGTRYSHILDPRTGQPLTRRSSATIIARDGMTADALATAVSVLGTEGFEIVEQTPGAFGLMTTFDGDQVDSRMSRGFGDHIAAGEEPRVGNDPPNGFAGETR